MRLPLSPLQPAHGRSRRGLLCADDVDVVDGVFTVLLDFDSGNRSVGIGTTTPQAALDVRGDILLGTSGTLHATSGPEKLRIVRGRVSSAGTALSGSGFTSSRTRAGAYLIGFSPTFPAGSAPAVTVSAEWTAGSAYVAMTNGVLHTATGIRITNGSGTLVDQSFYFIAVGPR